MTSFAAILLLTSQVMLPHRGTGVGASPSINLPLAGIFLRWVASDLPDGVVTNWTDRIQGVHFTNDPATGPVPIKSGNYVNWTSTNACLVMDTMTLDINGSQMSLVLIVSLDSAFSKTLQTFWSNGGSNPTLYFNYNTTNALDVFNFTTDSVIVTNLYTTAYGTNDIVTKWISGTSPYTWYSWLNGISNHTNTDILNLSGINEFGGRTVNAPTSPLRAKVFEVMVYTNFNSSEVAGIHTYATNTYKYSP